jgi:hypothetical protein
MALSIDDILEITFRGSLFGQTILNVTHYVVNVTGAGNTLDQLQEIATDIGNDTVTSPILIDWRPAVTNQFTFDEVRVQRVYPARTIYMRSLPNVQGQYVGTCPSANIAASIQKRGVNSGRTSNGRIQIAGVPREGMVDGEIDIAGYGVLLAQLRDKLALGQTTTLTPITIVPVIFNPNLPNPKYQLISSWLVQTTLRTMHRRTLRLGI